MAGYSVTAKAVAKLKTGYLVREEVIEASLASDCKVGDVVSISNEGKSTASIAVRTSTSTSTSGTYSSSDIAAAKGIKNAVAAGDLIIAQADMTMGYGHVPVENRDYRYNPKVASSPTLKQIAVYRIVDLANVIPDAEVTSAVNN